MGNKKYWWLKLKDTFFQQIEIKKLRRLAGGDTYTIIYLKLQLLSIKNDGIIVHNGVESTFEDELSLVLDESVEDIKMTVLFLQNHGLIESSGNEYLLPEASSNIGSESSSAERMRKHRNMQSLQLLKGNMENTEMSHCDTNVTSCDKKVTTEIRDRDKREDIEIDKDISFYKLILSNLILSSAQEYKKMEGIGLESEKEIKNKEPCFVSDKNQAVEVMRQVVKNNLDYDILVERFESGKERIGEIVELIVEVICSKRESIRIAGDDKSIECVKERLMSLNGCHVQYVLECLKNNTTDVRNVKQYILAALYNAPTTIDSYYAAKVAHDMNM